MEFEIKFEIELEIAFEVGLAIEFEFEIEIWNLILISKICSKFQFQISHFSYSFSELYELVLVYFELSFYRYLALESLCSLANTEFSAEAVRKHQETVINSLKVK